MDIEISLPNDTEYPKGSKAYRDRLRSFMHSLQAGKVLVFERQHRIVPGCVLRRIVTKWKFALHTEDLISTKGEAVAVWDSGYKVIEFDNLVDAEVYVKEKTICPKNN